MYLWPCSLNSSLLHPTVDDTIGNCITSVVDRVVQDGEFSNKILRLPRVVYLCHIRHAEDGREPSSTSLSFLCSSSRPRSSCFNRSTVCMSSIRSFSFCSFKWTLSVARCSLALHHCAAPTATAFELIVVNSWMLWNLNSPPCRARE